MNVQEAWHQGATGEGISVTILDDGIERSHPDLVANYDPLASYDVNQNDNDPTPRYDLIDSNRHGKKLLHSMKIVDVYSTVWTFHDFSITQILREINIGNSISAKRA